MLEPKAMGFGVVTPHNVRWLDGETSAPEEGETPVARLRNSNRIRETYKGEQEVPWPYRFLCRMWPVGVTPKTGLGARALLTPERARMRRTFTPSTTGTTTGSSR